MKTMSLAQQVKKIGKLYLRNPGIYSASEAGKLGERDYNGIMGEKMNIFKRNQHRHNVYNIGRIGTTKKT